MCSGTVRTSTPRQAWAATAEKGMFKLFRSRFGYSKLTPLRATFPPRSSPSSHGPITHGIGTAPNAGMWSSPAAQRGTALVAQGSEETEPLALATFQENIKGDKRWARCSSKRPPLTLYPSTLLGRRCLSSALLCKRRPGGSFNHAQQPLQPDRRRQWEQTQVGSVTSSWRKSGRDPRKDDGRP